MSKNLCDRGYRREDLVLLFRLIDWFIALPKREEDHILDTFLVQAVTTQSLEAFESVANQYVTEEALELENTEPSCGEGGNET